MIVDFNDMKTKAGIYRKGMNFKDANDKLTGLLGGGREIILKNDNDGEEARLSKTSIGKLVSNSAVHKSIDNGFTRRQHYAVISDIEFLFTGSVKIWSHPDEHGDRDVIIHRYAIPLHFDDEIAYITVKESEKYGKRIHNAELIKVGKLMSMLEAAEAHFSIMSFPKETLGGILEETQEKPYVHFPAPNFPERKPGGMLEGARISPHHPPSPSSGKHKGMLEEAGGIPLRTSRTMCFHIYNIRKLFNAVNTPTKIFFTPNPKESLWRPQPPFSP